MIQPPFLPAPVNHRHDGWTPERQWKFVEALSQTASVTKAARSIGMTVRSAHRLRQHPLAGDFRAAWDAALGQAWGMLEQVALDRAINGESETIKRDGYIVAERIKPCSDRLLIHLLASRERAQTAARAERAAAHKLALAEARIAAIQAGADAHARRRGKAAVQPAPPAPVLTSDAAADTAALQAFRALGDAFEAWPELDEALAEAAAAYTAHYEKLAADEAAAAAAGETADDGAEDGADDDPDDCGGATNARARAEDPEWGQLSHDYATRPRWEDHMPARSGAKVRQRASR